jgi:hypothetical protein
MTGANKQRDEKMNFREYGNALARAMSEGKSPDAYQDIANHEQVVIQAGWLTAEGGLGAFRQRALDERDFPPEVSYKVYDPDGDVYTNVTPEKHIYTRAVAGGWHIVPNQPRAPQMEPPVVQGQEFFHDGDVVHGQTVPGDKVAGHVIFVNVRKGRNRGM